jgi:hypothetical protein
VEQWRASRHRCCLIGWNDAGNQGCAGRQFGYVVEVWVVIKIPRWREVINAGVLKLSIRFRAVVEVHERAIHRQRLAAPVLQKPRQILHATTPLTRSRTSGINRACYDGCIDGGVGSNSIE